MKFCEECGHQMNDDEKFCPNCGKSTDKDANSDNTVSYTSEEEEDTPWYHTDIFHSAIAPTMDSFDNGSFFLGAAKTMIFVLSLLLLVSPVWLALQFHDMGIGSFYPIWKAIALTTVVAWLILVIFSFSYWMKRIRRLNEIFYEGDEFVVVPLGTYILQWIGEWLCLILDIAGIISLVIYYCHWSSNNIFWEFMLEWGRVMGIIAIVISTPVAFIFRVAAEKARAITSIANNTRRLSHAEEPPHDRGENYDVLYNILYLACILATVGIMLASMLH